MHGAAGMGCTPAPTSSPLDSCLRRNDETRARRQQRKQGQARCLPLLSPPSRQRKGARVSGAIRAGDAYGAIPVPSG